MAILGQLAALDHRGPTSGGVHRRHVVRAHTRCEFYFEGKNICKDAFLFLYGIVYTPKHGARPPAPLTPPAPKCSIMYVKLIIVCISVIVRVCTCTVR